MKVFAVDISIKFYDRFKIVLELLNNGRVESCIPLNENLKFYEETMVIFFFNYIFSFNFVPFY